MQQLTTDPTPDWLPRFSPDGSRIAFYAFRSGNRNLRVMSASEGQVMQITGTPAQDSHPSSEGNSLVFLSVRAENVDIYTIAVDGSGKGA